LINLDHVTKVELWNGGLLRFHLAQAAGADGAHIVVEPLGNEQAAVMALSCLKQLTGAVALNTSEGPER
jgi:hypothetical protein